MSRSVFFNPSQSKKFVIREELSASLDGISDELLTECGIHFLELLADIPILMGDQHIRLNREADTE